PRPSRVCFDRRSPGVSLFLTCCCRMLRHCFSPLCSVWHYSHLSSLVSLGHGAPFPVSSSDFRLIRKTPHLVLQWCMNSTGSFQPSCLNRMIVQSPSCRRSQLILVPIHSSGPSTTCHSTRLPGCSSSTFMSKPPALKRNCSTPPSLPSPRVSVVHQPERAFTRGQCLVDVIQGRRFDSDFLQDIHHTRYLLLGLAARAPRLFTNHVVDK